MTREQLLIEAENLSEALNEVLTVHEKTILRVLLDNKGV